MLAVDLNQNTSGEQGAGEKGSEASGMQASDPVLLDVLPSPRKLLSMAEISSRDL